MSDSSIFQIFSGITLFSDRIRRNSTKKTYRSLILVFWTRRTSIFRSILEWISGWRVRNRIIHFLSMVFVCSDSIAIRVTISRIVTWVETCPSASRVNIHRTKLSSCSGVKSCYVHCTFSCKMSPSRRRLRVWWDTPYFFSIAWIEGFDGPFSSCRASVTRASKGQSIAAELSVLMYVEVRIRILNLVVQGLVKTTKI